jgi:hypothetical protein
VRVEVLYIDGCPNRIPTVERVKASLKELRSPVELIEVPVTDLGLALAYRFLGSPTVRVNGIDVEPSARTATQFGLACRTYHDGAGRVGLPPVELIRHALEQAQLSESEPQCR